MRLVRFSIKAIFILCVLAVLALAALRIVAAVRETEARDDVIPAAGRLIPTAMGAIYVAEAGPEDGPPVLLIHGSVGWAHFWDETLTALGDAGYRAIAFDMPPMGYSDRDPGRGYDRTTQGARVLALTEALGITPILVAHSFGAGAGAEAVMQDQVAFAGFVVVAGAIGLENPGAVPIPLRADWLRQVGVAASVGNPWAMRPLLAAFLYRKDRALPKYTDILNQPMRLEGTTQAIADWLPTLFATSPDAPSLHPENWQALDLPMGFIWGREDTTTPLAQGARLSGLVPGADLTVLDDLGHIPHIEDPALFNAALLKVLARLGGE